MSEWRHRGWFIGANCAIVVWKRCVRSATAARSHSRDNESIPWRIARHYHKKVLVWSRSREVDECVRILLLYECSTRDYGSRGVHKRLSIQNNYFSNVNAIRAFDLLMNCFRKKIRKFCNSMMDHFYCFTLFNDSCSHSRFMNPFMWRRETRRKSESFSCFCKKAKKKKENRKKKQRENHQKKSKNRIGGNKRRAS